MLAHASHRLVIDERLIGLKAYEADQSPGSPDKCAAARNGGGACESYSRGKIIQNLASLVRSAVDQSIRETRGTADSGFAVDQEQLRAYAIELYKPKHCPRHFCIEDDLVIAGFAVQVPKPQSASSNEISLLEDDWLTAGISDTDDGEGVGPGERFCASTRSREDQVERLTGHVPLAEIFRRYR